MATPISGKKEQSGSIRIGIDVGGTFTHAIALDSKDLSLLGKAKVPTTHTASEGVARGIIEALQRLLSESGIAPDQVGFIAHSTTQATNALLEGDVAPVGILGLGGGANAWIASLSTNLRKIELAPQRFLETHHCFIDTTNGVSDETIGAALESLVKAGAGAIAISEAFSVDAPETEQQALAVAGKMGLYATAGSQVSQLYGLKVRTRTAVINAAMLPKMIESADMTERSVREAGIKAPVMIMRSDGGVMDIEAMRRIPIMTMLSGPAAGVAAAMMFLNISDGIFMEVGGTSTDISAISNGKAQVRGGEVGGHKVYMRTLDVRTVGVAGGSLPRMSHGKITAVGPRSAHIAGLKYVSFESEIADPVLTTISPRPGDPPDYMAFSSQGGKAEFCVTPTCAANLIGLVPDGDCAKGNLNAIRKAFSVVSKATGTPDDTLCQEILTLAAEKCIPIVRQLIKDHKLDPDLVTLVGGGGGAAAIVPFVAGKMGLRHTLAREADVISAIGVALALLRATVERQAVNPTSEDILKVRADAHSAVERMGAAAESIDVQVEVDARAAIIRATAVGAASMTEKKSARKELGKDERIALVADSMKVEKSTVQLEVETENFQIYSGDASHKELMGLFKRTLHGLRVLDSTGTIRLQFKNGRTRATEVGAAEAIINEVLEQHAEWGDAGKVIPDIMLLAGPKIIDLSGLLNSEQVVTLARAELEQLSRGTKVIVLAKLR